MRPRGTAAQLEERRRRAIVLRRGGAPYREVARTVRASVSSVVRWQQAYRRDHRKVVLFLRALLRHLRGPIELVWDGGSIHRRDDVAAFLTRRPRLKVHRSRAYAPELNPDEFVWTKLKHDLANRGPDDLEELDIELRRAYLAPLGGPPGRGAR